MGELFKLLRPHLSVIDGFSAVNNKRLKSALAIASSDAVAADRTAAKILKLSVPYLRYCGTRKKP